MPGDTMELLVETLGHKGDGIARANGEAIHIERALPGESVRVECHGSRGDLVEVINPSSDRQKAPCRHFQRCGGCAVQHIKSEIYLDWKRQLVVDALKARGIDMAVSAPIPVAEFNRRRATFTARRTKTGTMIGFHARRSDEIVHIEECRILMPEVFAILPKLHGLLRVGLSRRKPASIQVTATRNGLDIAVNDGKPLEGLEMRGALAGFAEELDLARLSWSGEEVSRRKPPVQSFAGIDVLPPTGAFLQAATEAESVIIERVCNGVGDAGRVLDLFSGVGTLSLPLARKAPVHAIEVSQPALTALQAAANTSSGLKPVSTERRDLVERPLMDHELAGYDAVVLDPPRAGAREQCGTIAQSDVQRVVSVSCNPATFARDARILIDGGFKLESVTPIDQFLYSPHVEVVGILSRMS